jgi:hypothetical protein
MALSTDNVLLKEMTKKKRTMTGKTKARKKMRP